MTTIATVHKELCFITKIHVRVSIPLSETFMWKKTRREFPNQENSFRKFQIKIFPFHCHPRLYFHWEQVSGMSCVYWWQLFLGFQSRSCVSELWSGTLIFLNLIFLKKIRNMLLLTCLLFPFILLYNFRGIRYFEVRALHLTLIFILFIWFCFNSPCCLEASFLWLPFALWEHEEVPVMGILPWNFLPPFPFY